MPPSRPHRSSTWCRCVWYFDQHGLTSIARCPMSWLQSPYYFFTSSPFPSLVARLIGFLALGIPQSSKVTNRLGPLPLVLRLPMDIDDLVSILSSQRRTRSNSSAPMHGDSHSAFPLLQSFARGTSSHSLWLQHAFECVIACLDLRTFVRPRGEYFPQLPTCGISLVSIPWYWSLPLRAQVPGAVLDQPCRQRDCVPANGTRL